MTVREADVQPKLTTDGCGEMPIRDQGKTPIRDTDTGTTKKVDRTTVIRTAGRDTFGAETGRRRDKVKGLVREQMDRPWDWNKVGMVGGAIAAVAGAAYAAKKLTSSKDEFELRLETDENVRLISSKKVEGTPVYGREGGRIGTVDSFMVDKYTGRVAYAIMRFGGTWGFGESLFPLPWPMLDYDEELGGYQLDLDKEELADAPRFEATNEPEFDPNYRKRVILFYRPR